MMTERYNRYILYYKIILVAGIIICLFTGTAENEFYARTGPAKSDQIKIIYIANQGYFLEIGDKKIFIDAIHMGVSSELIEKMTAFYPKKVTVEYSGGTSGDIHGIYADVSLAGKILGYEPKTDLDQGLKKMLEWAINV